MKQKLEPKSPESEKGEKRREIIINEKIEENFSELESMNVQTEKAHQGSNIMYESRLAPRAYQHEVSRNWDLKHERKKNITYKGSEIKTVFDFSIAILQTRRQWRNSFKKKKFFFKWAHPGHM